MSSFPTRTYFHGLKACTLFCVRMVLLFVLFIFSSVSFLYGQDYRGQDISGDDLSEQDLTGALFDNTTIFSDGANGVNLSNTGGTGANLSVISGAVDFRGVNLTGVNLSGANLSSANFDNTTVFSNGTVGADLSNTLGSGANLSGINFDSIDFSGVNLTGVNLSNANLSNATFDQNTIFSDGVNGANLSNTTQNGAFLLNLNSAVHFGGVNLAGASFYDNVGGESFDLSGATIDQTTIFSNGTVGVNLSATRANLSGLDLSNVDFQGANISGLDFTNANLTGALFDHNTIFSDIDGYGVNLFNDAGTGADLSGIDFSQSNNTGWGFEGANLVGVNLSNAVLSDGQSTSIMSFNEDTIFSDGTTGANLSNTNGNGAIISGLIEYTGTLRAVNLVGVKFKTSILEESGLFDGTTVFSDGTHGVDLSDTWANLSGLDLSNIEFRGANLSGVDLSNANLTGSDLSDVNLTSANLTGVTLSDGTTGANLSNTQGTAALLGGAPNNWTGNLSGANVAGVYLGGTNVTVSENTILSNGTVGANFIMSTINGSLSNSVDFRGVNLTGVDLSSFDLSQAQFGNTTVFSDGSNGVNLSGTNANLSNLSLDNISFLGAQLNGANLSDSNLTNTIFFDADLSNAQVNNSNLTGANLTDANLTLTAYNAFTIWPDGFDPVAAGAVSSDQDFIDYMNEFTTAAQNDGNQSGQSSALANPNNYDLYTEADKLLISIDTNHSSYLTGYADANATVVSAVAQNPNTVGLYTEGNRTTSTSRSSATVLARIQANLAMDGLSLVSYLENSRDTNATQTSEWYYQPELGWVWTTRVAYPYLYKAGVTNENNQTITEGWIFHNASGPDNYYFYDFSFPSWLNPF